MPQPSASQIDVERGVSNGNLNNSIVIQNATIVQQVPPSKDDVETQVKRTKIIAWIISVFGGFIGIQCLGMYFWSYQLATKILNNSFRSKGEPEYDSPSMDRDELIVYDWCKSVSIIGVIFAMVLTMCGCGALCAA